MKASGAMSWRTNVLGVLVASIGVVSCGADWFQEGDERPNRAAREQTQVPLSIAPYERTFSLAAPTTSDYVIAISNCSSGYTTTVTSTSGDPVASVPLYTGDGDCLAGLTSFTWSGVSYTGGPLTSGSSLFTGGGGEQLFVTVGTQLGATIDVNSQAIFLVSEIDGGPDYTISGYSSPAGLTVTAIEAPELEIPANGIMVSSIDGVSGVATLTVNVQCGNTLSADATSCQTPRGEDQPFASMTAKIVTDVYSNTLNYSQASTIMGSGATAVTGGDLSQVSPITTEGFTLSLSGEGNLYANRVMLLVIEYTDSTSGAKSYRYFNVNIGDPQ